MPYCRDITSLLAAEPDGTLDAQALARIEAHVATCPSCRQQRAVLRVVPAALRAASAAIASPDPGREWTLIQERIQKSDAEGRTTATGGRTSGASGPRPGVGKIRNPFTRRLLVWGLPLATAAAIAVVALLDPSPSSMPVELAGAASSPAGRVVGTASDGATSSLVYVDQESGWLIVWAEPSAG